jgi:hypothetical protein
MRERGDRIHPGGVSALSTASCDDEDGTYLDEIVDLHDSG